MNAIDDNGSPLKCTPIQGNAPKTGLLVTNHLNLMYMLATGLIMPPAGFAGKYYQDTLEHFAGWIPLFVGRVSKAAIEHSISEAGHLKPCIVEINLSRMSGSMIALGSNGLQEGSLLEAAGESDRVLLFPAPLPTSSIKSIVFRSPDDKVEVEAAAKDFGNVPLDEFKRGTRKKALFTKASDIPWPLANGPEERHAPLHIPFAAGGIMAMLLLFGNLGGLSILASRIAFDPDDNALPIQGIHPILSGLQSWVRDGRVAPESSSRPNDPIELRDVSQAELLWKAIERLVASRKLGNTGRARNLMIEHLSDSIPDLDGRLKTGVTNVRSTLESLMGLFGASTNELLDRHETPLARALTLFFLREDCSDLFGFESDRLNELDWLAAAILFGARDGWIGLPLSLRGNRGLSDAVACRMAQLSHRIAGTDLSFGEMPPRVRPLRELFGKGSDWKSMETKAAVELASKQKWNCILTRIFLRPGQYNLVVKQGSAQIELPGKPRITTEVDKDRFFELLSAARLEHHHTAKVRKALRG